MHFYQKYSHLSTVNTLTYNLVASTLAFVQIVRPSPKLQQFPLLGAGE